MSESPDPLSRAIEEANQALRAAIRTAYLTRDLALTELYEVRPLPQPPDLTQLIREVWVYPQQNQLLGFRLLTETIQFITTDSGTELLQSITHG